MNCYHAQVGSLTTGVGLSSDAALRFAGFLTCNNRTIVKSFLKKIARELIGNLHKNPPKFPENSRTFFLRNDIIIVRLSHVRNPAINLRIAELRLMRNPPQVEAGYCCCYCGNSHYRCHCQVLCH